MRNPPLLRFLAAVQEHTETGTTLMAAAGYDPIELQLAVTTAREHGFIEATGQVQPSLCITNAGRTWAAAELAPFAGLMARTGMEGRAA